MEHENSNSKIHPQNERINQNDTQHAPFIPESKTDKLFNSIVKIKMRNGEQGTGFFMKIKIKLNQVNFLLTCNHVIKQTNIDSKETIDIFYGKIREEINKKIKLDINDRLILTYVPPIDITLIEIINSDDIPDDKYLLPDYNYKNGFNYYKDKSFYMAGYPRDERNKSNERCICSGKIEKIEDFEFEHTLDTRYSSSGSPICLSENLNVAGIHKAGHKFEPINFGTFLGIILDKLENYENYNDRKILNEFNIKYNLNIKDNNIEILNLNDCYLGNEGLKDFCKIECNNLKALGLINNNISDINVFENVNFVKLEDLGLGNNKIIDINILSNVNFKNLKKLALNNNNISDIKVFENVNFDKLQLLWLYNNPININYYFSLWLNLKIKINDFR
jgi:V8-like Glu-specific endopeptidase